MSGALSQEESEVTGKVEELMTALDQVRKYRAFSGLLIDFVVILLSSIVILFAFELYVNFYRLSSGFPCYYYLPSQYTCNPNLLASQPSAFLQLFGAFALILIPTAGVLVGIFWVDRKLRSVKGGEWKEPLKEGFPGALRLLQSLQWDSVFEDMRISKIGYTVYSVIKVVGYWLLTFIILIFPYGIGISLLHTQVNLYILGLVSLILVLVLVRHDLGKRYRQVVSLDMLLWELRWFDSEFKRAEFKEGSASSEK